VQAVGNPLIRTAHKTGERTVSAVARELSRGQRSATLRCPLINGAR